ncbi:MAG TPA: hypothetical protein VGR78_17405, partial [Verrucomicrobiae bacterium]|nr:hypothetical protein [Verrucomicrobiae bacterium]
MINSVSLQIRRFSFLYRHVNSILFMWRPTKHRRAKVLRTSPGDRACVIFVAILFMVFGKSHAQESLTNGGNHPGTIPANKTNTYIFSGSAGDNIVLRVGATNVVPRIDLYGPSGTLIGSAPTSAPGGGSRDAVFTVQLASSGTFTVGISSYYAGGTGPYSLRFAQIPGSFSVPGGDDGGALVNGAHNAGTVDLGDLDVWTFTGNAGDNIQLRMGGTNVVPRIDLYGPTGTLISSEPQTAPGGGSRDALLTTQLSVSGAFTVVVSSYYLGGAGGYSLTLARAPGAITVSTGDEGGPLTNGAQHFGTLDVGDLDLWSFTADAGNSIQLRMNGTNVVPKLDLYGPDGTLISSVPAVAPGGGSRDAALSTQLAVGGIFTVVCSSYYENGAGSYVLNFIKIPGEFTLSPGDEGGALTNGWLHSGTIDLGDFDVWTFDGNTGDNVELRMGGVNLVPRIDLYNPGGVLIDSVPEVAPGGGSRDAILTNRLATNGTFTVVVSSYYFNGSGDYALTLAHEPGEIFASTGDEGGV